MPRRFALVLMAVSPAWAFDFSGLKKQGPVNDFARVLGPVERDRLQRITPPGVAVVTVSSLYREPPDAVARAIRGAWNEDVVLLLSPAEHRFAAAARDGVILDQAAILVRMSTVLDSRPDAVGAALIEAVHSVAEQRGQQVPAAPRTFDVRPFVWLIPAGALLWLVARKPRPASQWSNRGGFGAS
ncbi:MAG: hypothetical protein FJW39_24310 [Acidobacteria bacterium]|nr:hypothetical protein [Acidobacteriota bacterium]